MFVACRDWPGRLAEHWVGPCRATVRWHVLCYFLLWFCVVCVKLFVIYIGPILFLIGLTSCSSRGHDREQRVAQRLLHNATLEKRCPRETILERHSVLETHWPEHENSYTSFEKRIARYQKKLQRAKQRKHRQAQIAQEKRLSAAGESSSSDSSSDSNSARATLADHCVGPSLFLLDAPGPVVIVACFDVSCFLSCCVCMCLVLSLCVCVLSLSSFVVCCRVGHCTG